MSSRLTPPPEPTPVATALAREHADVETSSDDYARRFAGAVGAWFLAIQESATVRMLAPYGRATVLDVGGGHGQLTAALIAAGHRVTVFGSAECCRQRVEAFITAGTCAFESGDLLALPFRDRRYDVVVAYRLLAHVTRWQTLLREMARVADRAFLVDVPIRRSLNRLAPWLFALKQRVEGNTRAFSLFDEAAVLGVAASAGFIAVDRYAEFFMPMALHRVLRAPRLSAASERTLRAIGATGRFGSPVILKLGRLGP
jgi:2-polyprenyl-3-methyl-5-hydroxy-6-metoxy-1,4-benzoquinol methylase